MLCSLALSAALCGVQIVTTTTGYTIEVDGVQWLTGGDASFYAGQWLSAADGSLMTTMDSVSGGDNFGMYEGTHLMFTSAKVAGFQVDAFAKNYHEGFAVFDVVYTSGIEAHANSTADTSGTSTTYPSFMFTTPASAPALGVMSWKGTFIDDSNHGPVFGRWPTGLSTGVDGGPHALFDANHTVVISAASNFMTHSFSEMNNSMAAGLMSSVTSVPAGYRVQTMLSAGRTGEGINNAVQLWGDRMRRAYDKDWDVYHHDFTATHLGYNTDHGAYYYYHPNGTYADTLKLVQSYASQQKIPYRHVLLDSWWYFQGTQSGVKNWTARPGVFYEDGGDADLKRLHEETGWPFIAHNRFWAIDTTYATFNGGSYEFSDPITGDYVVPLEQRFWDDLLGNASKWGLKTYEQDWLYNEYNSVPLLHESPTQARTWLMQMGEAAYKHDINIQYCMPYPRHALQSLEIKQVSQMRVSDDYVPGGNKPPPNWNLGGSSILAHALAIRPFKDNYWTTSIEPGSSQGNTTNPDTPRHSAVATLTAGPVTPGDGAMYQNTSLIMKSTKADGRLLHPNRPCTYSDAMIRQKAGLITTGPQGHVWTTYSTVGDAKYNIVFVTELAAPYTLQRSELMLDGIPNADELVAYTVGVDGKASVMPFPAAGLPLAPASNDDFNLYYTAPVTASRVALLGELDKWVPASRERFTAYTSSNSSLAVTAMGSAGEMVHVSFYMVASSTVTTVSCTFTHDGPLVFQSDKTSCM
ncbi:hypothetical protein DIPPA_32060 [Diplonema papillatum]|nr:hypothetical protein DIPPA_32060 [Diplonema papillatum]